MDTTPASAATAEKSALSARPGDPCVMVIFGASGDLTKRKLIPALYNLAKDHLLAQEFALIGYARAGMTTEEFRAKIRDEIQQFATTKIDPDLWHWFERRIYYVSGGFDDARGLREPQGRADRRGQEPRDARERFLLSGDGAELLRRHREAPAVSGPRKRRSGAGAG